MWTYGEVSEAKAKDVARWRGHGRRTQRLRRAGLCLFVVLAAVLLLFLNH